MGIRAILAEIAEEAESGSGKSVWKEVLASSMPLAERESILKSYYVRAFSGTKNFDDWLIVVPMYSRSLGTYQPDFQESLVPNHVDRSISSSILTSAA